jgi:tetratricopeptide (TPR) repeat protein
MREQLEPRDEYGIAADSSALAALLEGVGEFAEAEELHLRALPIFEAAGDTHEAAMTRNGLGSVCQAGERWDEAARYYDTAADLFEANDPEHPAFGHVLNNRATLHRRLGEDAEARVLLERAHELLERTLGPHHPVTIEVEGNRRRVEASPSPYV